MTIDLRALRSEAATARAGQGSTGVPGGDGLRSGLRFGTEMRAKTVKRDGVDFFEVEGYASTSEQGYEMWDWFGPYTEVVDGSAYAETLAAEPMVVYRFNHTGTPMATTRNGRLQLWADSTGLGDRAFLNPKRADVKELVQAIEDRDVTEQSFMFRILDGRWSPDYTEYRITKVDLDRGDVGPVTYGANPTTTVTARSADFLTNLQQLPPAAARAALQVLNSRADLGAQTSTPAGRGLSLLDLQLRA